MIMKRTFILSLLLLGCHAVFAQQKDTLQKEPEHQFSINTTLWSRGEYRNGSLPADNGADFAAFLMSKNVVRLDYTGKHMEARFAPKFLGVWGAQGSGSLVVEEAWLGLMTGGWSMRLGRQKIAYDDERIIGTNDWSMATSTHDLVKLAFERGKHKVHLLAAFNQNDANMDGGTYYTNGAQPYKTMQALWYHFDPTPELGASLVFMNTGMQSIEAKDADVTEFQQLFGVYAKWKPSYLTLEASYYYQMGHDEYALPIYAWMASLEADGRISDWLRLKGGYFFMSGDKDFFVPREGEIGVARKTEVRGFNPIFGSHHQFYGAMDFFYISAYYGGNTPGLQDLHAGFQVSPIKNLTLDASYHLLAASVPIPDTSTQILGHEVELEASWQINKDLSLSAGYSFMSGTETMQRLKRGDKDKLHWSWLMLTATPEFLNYKW